MKNLVILLSILLFIMTLLADTTVPGGSVSGIWNAAGSPFLITGNIIVDNGSTLTIGPGVEVIFQGTYKLDVLGQIVCNGSSEEMITFTAADTLNGWSSIRFLNNGTGLNQPSEFNHTNFLYGRAIHGATGADMMNYGGAIWADNAGTITFNHCMFNRCKSVQDGSAVFARNGTNIVMEGCTVKHCESGFFGGVYVKQGNAEINNCIFLNNKANTFGAALYFYECPTAVVVSSMIVGSTAGAVAGIYSFSSPVFVMNSLFHNNTTTTGLGGGMGVIYGTLNLVNCTFTSNSSPQGGGAVWLNLLDAPAAVVNSIFWNNSPNVFTASSSFYILAYCSMQSAEGDQTNIFGDPLFTDLANGDLTLLANSPCIDTGTPDAGDLGLPITDLAGLPRIVDGNGDGTARIDIGCYEWQVPVIDGTLMGTVTDGQNQPLQSALIIVNDLSSVTNSMGQYLLTLAPGSYSVTCILQGFYPITVDGVIIEEELTTTLDFMLEPVSNYDLYEVSCIYNLRNHPNPFSRNTTISFETNKALPVEVNIYNLKGKKIKTLSKCSLKAGSHQMIWDGTDDDRNNVSTGIYLYKLEYDRNRIIRKVVKY